MEEVKKCNRCEKELTYDKFYKYPKSGKPWSYCKKCHYQRYTKDIKAKWDEKNPERKKEINRIAGKRWIENNREYVREYNRAWWKKNKSKKQT